MRELIKKYIFALLLSLLIFAVSAAVIAGALSIGRDKYIPIIDNDRDPKLDGESFNVLLIMTDYAPDKFSDYDPDAVKNIFGKQVAVSGGSETLAGYRKIYAEDMTLVRFDKEQRQITYTHIAGNTLVSVGGVKTKLENVPADYGTQCLVDKVHALLGVEIDRYILFTPENAARALDRIGEITYTVQCDMSYTDEERGIDINIKAGSQKLDGKKAVEMLRFDNYKALGTSRGETAMGYLKRFVNKIAKDFTEDEIRDIIVSVLNEERVVSGSASDSIDESIKLLLSSDGIDVIELSPVGQEQTVGDERYFWLDEKATLEKFSQYRRINSPEDIWG